MAAVKDVERPDYRYVGGESELLAAMLDRLRSTFLWKCEGLSDDQLRRRSAAPSTLSLLDLMRHLTEAERYWFQHCVAGRDLEPLHAMRAQGYVDENDSTPTEQVVQHYRTACEESRRIAAGQSLDHVVQSAVYGCPVSVRFIAVHLVEEYARHCGHADLLRESIDGAVGE